MPVLFLSDVIKDIYINEGVSTYRGIASVLNERDIKTRRGCKWTPVQVSRIILRMQVLRSDAKDRAGLSELQIAQQLLIQQ